MYGRDPRPEEECTADQLAAVDTLLKRDCAPYVDFGVWGPNHRRLLQKLRNTGFQLHVGGVLRKVEMSGPPDVNAWSECYNLLSTALVGSCAVGLGPMLDCSRLMLGYVSRYGTLTWPLLYQSDVRCRLAYMERLRRVLKRNHAMALPRRQAPAMPFDVNRPWGFVWSGTVDDQSLWHRQFVEPALIILTKAGRLTDVITGEAPTKNKSRGAAGRDNHPEQDRKRRKTTQKPRVEQSAKVHRESNGVYTHNRRGVALCADFQSRNCASTTGIHCLCASGTVHQCNRCLSEKHGGSSCTLTPHEPSFDSEGTIGKGKGKN